MHTLPEDTNLLHNDRGSFLTLPTSSTKPLLTKHKDQDISLDATDSLLEQLSFDFDGGDVGLHSLEPFFNGRFQKRDLSFNGGDVEYLEAEFLL